MFPQGQLNDPNSYTDQWTPNVYDFANQSACGIPDNACLQGKAAIHPYFLKYAGLDRKPYRPGSLSYPNPRACVLTSTFDPNRVLHAGRMHFSPAREWWTGHDRQGHAHL